MWHTLSRRDFSKLSTGAVLGVGVQLAGAANAAAQTAGLSAHVPADVEEFSRLADKVSNWGRWGAEDQLGAVNFVTPQITKRAGALVTRGEVVHCGGPIPGMQQKNLHEASLELSASGTDLWKAIDDRLTLEIHGRPGQTHLDALAHVFYRERGYNNREFPGTESNRMPVNGIEAVRDGIVGRGVFIDLPRAFGKRWLEPGDLISPDQFARLLRDQRVELKSGDILYIRHGHAALAAQRERSGPTNPLAATGGLSLACAEMLHRAEPSIIATDGGLETAPAQVQGIFLPWHILCIVMMGVRLVDGAHLERLASACIQFGRSEFLTTIAPIEITGGSASPVNPLCIF